MRLLIWAVRLLLFFLLFGFAVKNDQLVTLNFFFRSEWQLPLVFVILAAFAAGSLLGVTATFASLLSYRREAGRYRKSAVKAEKELREMRSAATEVRKAA